MLNLGLMATAMVTPFKRDKSINYELVIKTIEHLIDNNTTSLVVASTTGEGSSLNRKEKLNLIDFVLGIVDKRINVFAGTGSNNTEETIELTKDVEKMGVDGVLVVTPYYVRPNQRGVYEHFKSIAESTSLPVMLYNVPSRTASTIDVDTVVELSKIKNIFGIKDATGDLSYMSEIIRRTNSDFQVYTGNDSNILPCLSIGAKGVVSVSSHVIGSEIYDMITNFLMGDIEDAAEIHRKILPLMEFLFSEPSPSPVKEALKILLNEDYGIRLPLVEVTKETSNKLQELLNNIKSV